MSSKYVDEVTATFFKIKEAHHDMYGRAATDDERHDLLELYAEARAAYLAAVANQLSKNDEKIAEVYGRLKTGNEKIKQSLKDLIKVQEYVKLAAEVVTLAASLVTLASA